MGKLLTKAEDILALEDLKTEFVDVPEWGEGIQVKVRGMTAEERDDYEQSLSCSTIQDGKVVLKEDWKNSKARLVVRCVVDEEGDRVFKDEQATKLAAKNGAVVNRIYKVAARLSGMGREAEKVIEGNSVAGNGTASS